jgi:exopolysaccharide biosynthesis polyprenyl glycosylphosphotransferase
MSSQDALETRSAALADNESSSAGSRGTEIPTWGPWTPRRSLPNKLPVAVPAPDPSRDGLAEGNPASGSASRYAFRRRLLVVADVIAATTAFVLAVPVLSGNSLGIGALIAIAMVIPVCKLAGLYDRDEHLLHKTTLDEAPALVRVAALYTLLAFMAGETIVAGTFGREQALFLWGFLFLSMLLMRGLSRRVAGALVDGERCVVVGSADAAHRLDAKLERCIGTRATIVGRVPLSSVDTRDSELPVLGSFNSLGRLLEMHQVDRAVIAPGPNDGDRLLDAIRVVKRLGVRISVLPRLLEAVGSAYELDEVEGATLLGLRRHGLSRSSKLIKRSFDIVGASVILAMCAPLMAAIAIAIKLDSRGPVFFRQRRVGHGDSVFEIYKLRTMVDGADTQRAALAHRNEASGGLFKIEDDPRVTRVGHFLRKTSIDELPQLFNVLRGDMSLVGPRPLVVNEDRLIEGLQRQRLLVPPGVTGLWQIFGSARIPLDEMVKIDYLYGANWSLWLDIKILLRTVPFVLGRRGL